MKPITLRRSFAFFIIAALMAMPLSLRAGARKIHVQGKLTDSGGAPLSGIQTVTFKLYDAASGGAMVWTSGVLSVTPASGGLFNVPLQDGTPSLDSVSFDKTYYLGITVGADPEMTPRQEMGASALSHGSLGDFQVKNNLIVSNGKLGIGTASPSSPVNIVAPAIQMTVEGTVNQSVQVEMIDRQSNAKKWRLVSGMNNRGGLQFYQATNNIEAVEISPTGNVGIGMVSPNDKLHVKGNIVVEHDGLGINLRRPGYDEWAFGQIGMGLSIKNQTDNRYDFVIDGDGKVGIGTPAPSGALEVSRNTDPSVIFRNTAPLAPNNYVRLNMLGGGSEPMLDTNFIGAVEGKVVSVSPLKTMLWFRTNIGNNSAQVAAIDELGRMWASSFNVMSDERLKTDSLPLTETLGKLKKINAKSFRWKKNVVGFGAKKRQIGFYAQEVEAVFPELVTEIAREDGVYKGVDYGAMVPILLEAIKDQQKEIEGLTVRLKALEKR